MKPTLLFRSVSYWVLLLASLVAVGLGGWLVSTHATTMTTKLLDGSATGVEVYVGQSLIGVGAAILGAGIIGLLLTLALATVARLTTARTEATVPVEDSVPPEHVVTSSEDSEIASDAETHAAAETVDEQSVRSGA